MNFTFIALNLLYAAVGGLGAIAFMYFDFKVIDHVTPFDAGEQLREGNTAVGVMVPACSSVSASPWG